MTKELQDKLYTKYDVLFRDRSKPMSETCMCWGCDVNDGWYAILDYMCSSFMRFQKKYDVTVVFDQIKEKFGTLRVYHHLEFGPRWSSDRLMLDGKSEIEYVSLGWHRCGEMMPALEGVENLADEAIRIAEKMSEITCEQCGMTGATQTKSGWIKTLCDKCRKE
jgi:hypothetical protein